MARMTLAEAKERISATVLEQFEDVRASGECNMMDTTCVTIVASERGYIELAGLDREDYVAILTYYSDLREYHFG